MLNAFRLSPVVDAWPSLCLCMHTVSQRTIHLTFGHNFGQVYCFLDTLHVMSTWRAKKLHPYTTVSQQIVLGYNVCQ